MKHAKFEVEDTPIASLNILVFKVGYKFQGEAGRTKCVGMKKGI